MLLVLVKNDRTGTNESANYDYEVRVNATTIYRGRIEGHNRDDGWRVLLSQIAELSKERPAPSRPEEQKG